MAEPNYIYHIAERNGKLFVSPLQRPLLNADELDQLARELHEMAELSRRTGLSSGDLYSFARCEQLAPELTPLHWVFPTCPQDTFKSGTSVYFMSATNRPGQIKIGCTNCVASRCTALRKLIKSPARIIAFAQTAAHRTAELYFHHAFHRYWIENEWYKAAPVMAYLDQIRNGCAK